MAYAAWSVSFGEQPSAAKWNILGTNDSFFNTQVGANFGSGTTSTVWWEELGRTQLGGTGDTISVTPIEARKFLQILCIALQSGQIAVNIRFNNDSANNYSYRQSSSGGADGTATSQGKGWIGATGTEDQYHVFNVTNISNKEKLIAGVSIGSNTAGAANAPNRLEGSGKWANTAAQITRVDAVNTGTGDFAAGSLLVVMGHD